MNLFFSPKRLAAVALATVALGAATVAEARPEVYVSIGLQSGPAWVEQAPVYVQPAPVYARPPVFVRPREVHEHPHWGGHHAHHRWECERAWRRAEWLRHQRHDGFRGSDRDPHAHGHHRGYRY